MEINIDAIKAILGNLEKEVAAAPPPKILRECEERPDRYRRCKVGFLIADSNEYESAVLDQRRHFTLLDGTMAGNSILRTTISRGNNIADIDFIYSGIGLSRAAGTAGAMTAHQYSFIVNAGLSGAISGLQRDDIVICDRFIEHDFDLTPLGYQPGQKDPMEPLYSPVHPLLHKVFSEMILGSKSGTAASGNGFIADREKKQWIKEQFGASCCDMESAAVADVCRRSRIPFISVRKISDTADDFATSDYSSYSTHETASLFDCVCTSILTLLEIDEFWQRHEFFNFSER